MQQQESTSLAEWTRTTVRTFLASSYLLPSEVKVSLYIYVTCFFAYSATYGIRLPLFVPFYDDYPFQTVLGVETQVKVPRPAALFFFLWNTRSYLVLR